VYCISQHTTNYILLSLSHQTFHVNLRHKLLKIMIAQFNCKYMCTCAQRT